MGGGLICKSQLGKREQRLLLLEERMINHQVVVVFFSTKDGFKIQLRFHLLIT